MTATSSGGSAERMETRVPGLDEVLSGGMLLGTTNLVIGPPGTGKTVLAAQVAFGHVAQGGRAVYMTLLSEPQGQLVSHLSRLTFFDPQAVPDALYFVSGYQEAEEGGTEALLALIRGLIRDHEATLLILDGLPVVDMLTTSEQDFQRFLHELHALVAMTRCTTLTLAAASHQHEVPEAAQFDSVLHLEDNLVGLRSARSLHVAKLRGSAYLRGRHAFDIDAGGLTVFPRCEARVPLRGPEYPGSAGLGVHGLEAMIPGGLPNTSSTLVLGPPGVGKTLLSLAFLDEGAARGEPGIYLGLGEPKATVLAKAGAVGLSTGRHVSEGRLELAFELPVELSLDMLAARLFDRVQRLGARRLVFDGLSALRVALADPGRILPYLSALVIGLRSQGVTALLTEDLGLFGTAAEPEGGASAFVDNIILLRYVEASGRLHRVLSVVEVGSGRHETSTREVLITERGLAMGRAFETLERAPGGFLHGRVIEDHG